MKQHFRKALSVVSVFVLLIGIMMSCAFTIIAEDTETTVTYITKTATEYVAISDENAFKTRSDVGHLYSETDGTTISYYAYRFSGDSPVDGWAVYDAGEGNLAKQFEVSAYMIYNNDPAKLMSFSVSNDMEHWTDVTATGEIYTEKTTESGTPYWSVSGSPVNYWAQCVYTGEASMAFRYIRVNFAAVAEYVPGLHYVKMASYVPDMAESYANTITADEGVASSEDGTFYKWLSSGNDDYYGFINAEQTKTNGEIVFKSMYPITDYNFRTVECSLSDKAYDGSVAFAASKDGSDWVGLGVYTLNAGVHNNGWRSAYYDSYGSLAASEGYYYLRATIIASTNGSLNEFPTIAYLQYNSAIPTDEELTAKTYMFKQLPTDGVAVGENGSTLGVNTGTINGYYSFVDANSKGEAGTITFNSVYPITDIHFDVYQQLNTDILASFEVSQDGTDGSWKALNDLILIKGAESPGGALNGYFADYYGHFLASDNYHYIRVTLPKNIWELRTPAFAYVEFDAVIPDSYAVAVASKNGVFDSTGLPYTSASTDVNPYGYTAFTTGGESTGSVAGTITFESDMPITDLHIHMLKDTLKQNIHTIEVSADGDVWDTPKLLENEGLVTSPSWGTQIADYYTVLSAEEGYRFIRVSLAQNCYGVRNPTLGYVEYNYELTYPGECSDTVEILTSLVDNKQAIRFWHTLQLAEGETDAAGDDVLTVNGTEYTIDKIGVLFAYQDTLNGAELTADNAAVNGNVATYRSRTVENGTATYSFTTRIINIKQENRDRDIICRGYIMCTPKDGGEAIMLMGNSIHASVLDVYGVTDKSAFTDAAAMESWMNGEVVAQ